MGDWNFAYLWENAADAFPEHDCLIHGERRLTWRAVDRRADGVAQYLLDAGIEHQQAVAQYLYNCPEYMESTFAAFKAAFVPVNTNYRYTADELLYLWDNADAGAVVFHAGFAPTIEAIRARLPKVRAWLWVADGTHPCPPWATPYEAAAATATAGRVVPDWGRSGDDLDLLYTGGTTGMPKGVMWRQDDLAVLLAGTLTVPLGDESDYAGHRAGLAEPGRRFLPACPQMHGTGNFPGLVTLAGGGTIVTLEGRGFDPVALLDTIEREAVQSLAIVGDAFGKPILQALDANPGRWDLSSLVAVASSGVMWSRETKQGLLRHHPGMLLLDAFSSSEALGMGASVSAAGTEAATATFRLTPNSIVIDEFNRPVPPGSGEIGRLAVGGRVPLGYYKDPDKTARTFLEIDGRRYSCPGDYATVEADGSITLLGRGSVCINTGGEKVFPEEVEEALKRHGSIADAVVVGVPDEKYGEMVTAVVELRPGVPESEFDESVVIGELRKTLAGYKAPKHVLVVATIGRAANGKVDYKRIRSEARAALTLA